MHEHTLDKDCWCEPEVIVVDGPEYPFTITIDPAGE